MSTIALAIADSGDEKPLRDGSKPGRISLAKYGHGVRMVRVFVEAGYVRVMWRERGERRYQSWPDKRQFRQEAKAFAQGLSDTIGRPKDSPTLTLRQLWARYREIEFPHLRPNTQRLYDGRWARWELFIGKDAVADDVTLNHVDEFRKKLVKHGTAVNQVKEIIKVAKVVHNWGESREVITKNRLGKYRFKVSKADQLAPEPAEYTVEERDRMLAVLSPRLGTRWRPWALLMILGNHGVRASAALHLRWDDIDEVNGEVIWRAEFDKVGREWRQPLTHEIVSALAWARHWRERFAYDGPWVFFSRDARNGSRAHKGLHSGVYRIQSLLAALVKSETRAGVEHLPYRGAHGMRKMVAGEVNAKTGNPVLAMHYIGDTDMKTMKRYLKRRDDRLREVADTWTTG